MWEVTTRINFNIRRVKFERENPEIYFKYYFSSGIYSYDSHDNRIYVINKKGEENMNRISFKNKIMAIRDSKFAAAGVGLGYLAMTTKAYAARTWPWTGILNDIKDELTGPLPLTLGTLGIVVAAVGLFAGNAGDGMRKFLVIILAISVALFAPTFVEWIADSAS